MEQLVLDVHHLLLLVIQILPSNHVYQLSMLPQLLDLMLHVHHAQLVTTLLNVSILLMLLLVYLDLTQLMVLVKLVHQMHFHVMDKLF
jgi:hypothetical protein